MASGLIGARSVSGSEGAGGVTSILREDILEEGTLFLAGARVFGGHLKSWQVFFFFFSPSFSHALWKATCLSCSVFVALTETLPPKGQGDRFFLSTLRLDILHSAGLKESFSTAGPGPKIASVLSSIKCLSVRN